MHRTTPLSLGLAALALLAAGLVPGAPWVARAGLAGLLLAAALLGQVWWFIRDPRELKALVPACLAYVAGAALPRLLPEAPPLLQALAQAAQGLGFYLAGTAFLRVALDRAQAERDSASQALHRERLDAEARFLLTHDALTGLGNRRALLDRLEDARSAQRHGSLLWLDLEGFRSVNAQLGYRAADDLLKTTAHVLSAQGEAYRVDGDAFALVLWETPGPEAIAVARRLEETLGELRLRYGLGVCLGCATFDPGQGPDALMLRAEESMREARRRQREGTRPVKTGQVLG